MAQRIGLTRVDRFVTLTVRFSPYVPTVMQLDSINHAWRLLYKRIKRRFPNAQFGYVKVVEFTKKGTPHLHIALQGPFIHQRWLSRQWQELTGSSVVDIRKIQSERSLARYLSKYLTKSKTTVRHRRKYAASRGFLPPLPDDRDDVEAVRPSWNWSPGRVDSVRASLLTSGWQEFGDWLIEPPEEIAARALAERHRGPIRSHLLPVSQQARKYGTRGRLSARLDNLARVP